MTAKEKFEPYPRGVIAFRARCVLDIESVVDFTGFSGEERWPIRGVVDDGLGGCFRLDELTPLTALAREVFEMAKAARP